MQFHEGKGDLAHLMFGLTVNAANIPISKNFSSLRTWIKRTN